MGEIRNIEEKQLHVVSEVICVDCCHRWISTRPEDTLLKNLECPTCGKQGTTIETGQVIA